MIETWKHPFDQQNSTEGVSTYLSKAFDCLNHNLLIAKLDVYGFDKNALAFIFAYLTERRQRTKITNTYSSWKDIKYRVPQGSICP